MPSPSTGPPAPTTAVLLVSAQEEVVETVARLAAAVGVPVECASDAGAAGRAWSLAPLVLIGEDAAALGAPLRRSSVVLLAGERSGDRCWRRAVEIGAEAVVRLPADERWLLDRLACVADGGDRSALVVGVVGGRGGAGASTLAAGLASVAATRGREVLLVDGDPVGGGIDLLLGAEQEPGLRWHDLEDVRGALRGSVLRAGLPQAGGVRFLSWTRRRRCQVSASAVESVLDAARRSHDLVVVDLPRGNDPATAAALWRLDVLLVVVPAEVRAASAAARVVQLLGTHVADVRLVVRGPAPTGLGADVVADAVGLPLTARWAGEPDLPGQGDRGEPPGRRRRSPLTRLCHGLLDELAGDGGSRSASVVAAARAAVPAGVP